MIEIYHTQCDLGGTTMSYRVIVDSCGELTEEMKQSGTFVSAALTMQVGEYHIIDDETFDQADFLKKVAECPESPKSSCPSPEQYLAKYNCDADHIYVVTLSAELSGSYNSAQLGKNLYFEEYGEKDIYVFNSRSASVGETLIALKIQECEEAGMDFQTVIDTVEAYIEGQHTYFVLENLDTLRKNGRLTGIKSLVAGALNIKPVMGSTPEGTICQKAKARGMKKALVKMADYVEQETENTREKVLAIAHCNCEQRAKDFEKILLEKMEVKKSIIVDTAGISSMYANDGGIIVVI